MFIRQLRNGVMVKYDLPAQKNNNTSKKGERRNKFKFLLILNVSSALFAFEHLLQTSN